MIKSGAGGCPWPPGPGEPVPSVPPVGEADFWKGVQGDISSWSQAEGREGEEGSEATVGRGLIVPSRTSGPPFATGSFGQPPAPVTKITCLRCFQENTCSQSSERILVDSRKNIYPDLIARLKQGQPLALATIIETSGSTPQVAGASAIFSEKGLVLGTLGGGIMEADAQKKASSALKKKKSLFYEFKLQGDGSSEEEAACGGSVAVLIDASPSRSLQAFVDLRESLRLRRAGILATRADVSPGGEAAIHRLWVDPWRNRGGRAELKPWGGTLELEEILREGNLRVARRAARRGRADELTLLFLEPVYPLARLVIAGAGHVGQALAHLGKFLDFEVTVIDDRPEFASHERIPEADAIIVGDIGQAVRDFPVSADTYIVIVTRGHRHDAEALQACLRSPAAYIGMIGSARKVALMREKFLGEGWATAVEFDRVRAPVGLRIGSKTVEEIAVSIAAELVLARSQARGEPRG